MRRIWKIAKRISWPVSFVAAWVGILFLPKDIGEAGEAVKVWGFLMPAIDRDTALIAFSGLLVVSIIWIDVLPSIRGWWKRRKSHALTVIMPSDILPRDVICVSKNAINESICKRIYLIGVQNNHPQNKTIRNVQARVQVMIDSGSLPIEGSDKITVDLQHGVTAYFEVGYILHNDDEVIPRGVERIDLEEFSKLKLFTGRFSVLNSNQDILVSLHEGDKWDFDVVFSADDLPAITTRLTVDPANVANAFESVSNENNRVASDSNKALDKKGSC